MSLTDTTNTADDCIVAIASNSGYNCETIIIP